eukprot:7313602-Pyramimonas_sp.AAC.2
MVVAVAAVIVVVVVMVVVVLAFIVVAGRRPRSSRGRTRVRSGRGRSSTNIASLTLSVGGVAPFLRMLSRCASRHIATTPWPLKGLGPLRKRPQELHDECRR